MTGPCYGVGLTLSPRG